MVPGFDLEGKVRGIAETVGLAFQRFDLVAGAFQLGWTLIVGQFSGYFKLDSVCLFFQSCVALVPFVPPSYQPSHLPG